MPLSLHIFSEELTQTSGEHGKDTQNTQTTFPEIQYKLKEIKYKT